MAQFSVKIMRLTGSVLGENQQATFAMLLFAAATQGYFLARSKAWESAALLLVAFTMFVPNFWLNRVQPELTTSRLQADWALCAFGRAETACLAAAFAAGGKARVGFVNSLEHADGRIARDNAERVAEIAALTC